MSVFTINESGLIRTISPKDEMFDRTLGEESYFSCGRSALEAIGMSLQAAHKAPGDVKGILDLPCGHGRILRYLRAAFPDAEITACDILRDGVDFCAAHFGAVPVYSRDDPTMIPLETDSFDLIWVGSLFTHFDADIWPIWLTVLRSLLRSGGVLVFTTHGRQAYENMINGTLDYRIIKPKELEICSQYEKTGFGHVKYPGSDGYYGLTLSDPSWVFRQIARLGDTRVVLCSERGWGDFHDVFACVRDPDWLARRQPMSAVAVTLRQRLRERAKALLASLNLCV